MSSRIVPENQETLSRYQQIEAAPNDELPIVEMNEENARDIEIIWQSVEGAVARWRGNENCRIPGMPMHRKHYWGACAQAGAKVHPSVVFKSFIGGARGEGKLAIDLGCGNTMAIEQLLQKGWKVIAVDNSPAVIKILRERLSSKLMLGQLTIIQADAATYIPNERADLVLASDIFPYIDPSQFPSTWDKVHKLFLKANGCLIGSLFRSAPTEKEVPLMNREKEKGAWFLPDRRMVRSLLTHTGYEVSSCVFDPKNPLSMQFLAEKKRCYADIIYILQRPDVFWNEFEKHLISEFEYGFNITGERNHGGWMSSMKANSDGTISFQSKRWDEVSMDKTQELKSFTSIFREQILNALLQNQSQCVIYYNLVHTQDHSNMNCHGHNSIVLTNIKDTPVCSEAIWTFIKGEFCLFIDTISINYVEHEKMFPQGEDLRVKHHLGVHDYCLPSRERQVHFKSPPDSRNYGEGKLVLYLTPSIEMPDPSLPKGNEASPQLLQEFASQMISPEASVKILCADADFVAHASILEQSSVIQAILNSSFKEAQENTISFPENVNVIKAFIQFLYDKKDPFKTEELDPQDMLDLAIRYNVDDLTFICAQFICSRATDEQWQDVEMLFVGYANKCALEVFNFYRKKRQMPLSLEANKSLKAEKINFLLNVNEVLVDVDVGYGNTFGYCSSRNWNKVHSLTWTNEGWKGNVPAYEEFKFVKVFPDGKIEWEQREDNRIFYDEVKYSIAVPRDQIYFSK